jgi:hypothetical protein
MGIESWQVKWHLSHSTAICVAYLRPGFAAQNLKEFSLSEVFVSRSQGFKKEGKK